MSVPDSLKGHPPDPPDDEDEAREADEFARRDRIDDYTPATAIPKETKKMSGYGYDTETLTLVVILPDGEPVRVVGEHDGVNGFTWSASRGANVLEVRTDHRVLIDGTTEVDPTVDAPHAVVGDDGIVRCSECNSAEFTYQENHPSERRQARNEHGALAFYGDFEWFEGDDDPGVVCANGHTVDTSGIEVDWA